MASDDSLKRLGGGRWETRDGRFAIEPQSGTWVVVDNSQTDELGLPLVRGPFGSLTAAREAIEGVRDAGPVESPLADRLREAKAARTLSPSADDEPERGAAGTKGPAATNTPAAAKARPAAEPEPPPEPKWLLDLAPSDRRRARQLIARLEKLEIAEAATIARAEIAMDQPALTRVAIERGLRMVIATAMTTDDAVRAAARVLSAGSDRELDARWRLVDDRGRPVNDLDLGT